MPPIEPDDDPNPAPGGGGKVDYIARIEAAGRVVGRCNARIAALDQGKRHKGRAEERARLLHYSEMGHAASARYQTALGRSVQIADHDFVRACNPAYDAELARLIEAPTKNALQNANHSDGVGGLEDDKGGNVCEAQESIKADTLAELASTAIGEAHMAHEYRRKLARADHEKHTSDGRQRVVDVIEENLRARQGCYERIVGELPPDLAVAVHDYCTACEDVHDAVRAVEAWHDHIAEGLLVARCAENYSPARPVESRDYKADYRMMAQEFAPLQAAVERAAAARQSVLVLGIPDDKVWNPTFALEVTCFQLRELRKAINKQMHLGLRADKAEKLA